MILVLVHCEARAGHFERFVTRFRIPR